ncbi:DEAD-box ATP-dependent RNA helicase CshA [Mucinivorans hirudinis]|uniref:DEAD-box ATP-dependent RNA helicase CshA n=1 Tax=Mucinivorans hirudinis TaxID=1433126 RepID=A0A060RDW2_9BACT|nr:DEAD-box ATP-dependent RNA helicase CshA [Mucinivorans hirudinis]
MILEEFAELGLSEATLHALQAKGFETPSPIQRLTIPVMMQSEADIIGQAQTGTGKTAAFGLPIIEQLIPQHKTVQALILVPTRELAIQVTDEIQSFRRQGLKVTPIYGGAAIQEQLRRLASGVDIVVGTPGRILDHLGRGTLDLSQLKWLVLDEADEMLNMGFIDDVDEIISYANDKRRIMLFSATMPQRISELAGKYMHNVEHIKVQNKQLANDLTDQIYFEVRESDKFDALTRIIDVEQDFYGIVFCRTKVAVDLVVNNLIERGYAAEGLHGDVSQAMREKILGKFRKRHCSILVATDVAARGIDVSNLTHVVNYSLPQDFESYVHRIGRTGRAGNEGMAITFITPSEYRAFTAMQHQVKTNIRKEQLPSAQDVVEVKKAKIREDIADIITYETYSDYLDMAAEILAGNKPEIALAAMLRLAFKAQLDESNYPEIRRIDVDRRGTVRLFIALGKVDGYRPKMIVDLLKKECNISDRRIDDVKCMDTFSFASIPFEDAEKAIKKLNSIKKLQQDDRPLVSIAKEDTPQNDRPKSAVADRPKRKPSSKPRNR